MTRLLLVAAAAAAALVATPAHAVGNIATYVAYTQAGAFTCHAVAAYGPTTAKLGDATRISCTVNGVRETVHQSFGWHAHAAGAGPALAAGSTATLCVDASTVYGLFPPLFVHYTNCATVVVQPGGAVVQV